MRTIMKTLILFVLTMFSQTVFAGEPGKLHITGKLAGTSDTIEVRVMDTQGHFFGEKNVLTKDNTFDFTVDIQEVCRVMITNLKNGQPGGWSLSVFAVPGDDCHITGTLGGEFHYNGTGFYKDYNEMDQVLAPVIREREALNEEANRMVQEGKSREEARAYYNSKINDVKKRIADARLDFIMTHPDNEANALLIGQIDPEKVHEAYNVLSERLRNGRMAPTFQQALAQADYQMAQLEMAKSIAPGKPAPQFTLNDINGKPLSLSSFRGKYVLLDFWGSWCVWCIKGFPDMKKYYDKYKGKFEIIGIDCNDTEEKWKEAVKKHELPWLHVYNPSTSDLTTRYVLKGYPTKIMIDPEGNIHKVVTGEDPAFYTYLDELFK